jgi:hypothetical protein
MTLGNMRQNGVRGLDVTCLHCGHRTQVNMDAYSDDIPVPSFGPGGALWRHGVGGDL